MIHIPNEHIPQLKTVTILVLSYGRRQDPHVHTDRFLHRNRPFLSDTSGWGRLAAGNAINLWFGPTKCIEGSLIKVTEDGIVLCVMGQYRKAFVGMDLLDRADVLHPIE